MSCIISELYNQEAELEVALSGAYGEAEKLHWEERLATVRHAIYEACLVESDAMEDAYLSGRGM